MILWYWLAMPSYKIILTWNIFVGLVSNYCTNCTYQVYCKKWLRLDIYTRYLDLPYLIGMKAAWHVCINNIYWHTSHAEQENIVIKSLPLAFKYLVPLWYNRSYSPSAISPTDHPAPIRSTWAWLHNDGSRKWATTWASDLPGPIGLLCGTQSPLRWPPEEPLMLHNSP